MRNTTTTETNTASVGLNDSRLFREACYMDGAWIPATDEHAMEVDNPATEEIIGRVPRLGALETRQAIEAAHDAVPSWRRKTAKERAAVLRRWSDLMLGNQEDLARLMTIEQGKPFSESRGEVLYAAGFLEWFGEEAKRAYGDTIPQHQPDKRIVVVKEPVGVVACITPWNFPLAMITRKAGPAIAAGCTVVLKPAPQTPFSALALAELGERAGLPKGVFNVVTGPAEEVGGELTSNPLVRALSFTGSTRTGKLLITQCANTVKKVSLELGGNAPFLVFDDADLDAAVEGAVQSKFRNSGQTCVCANRFLVESSIHDAFAEKLVHAVKALNPAPGLQPDSTQGPLIDDNAVAKVERHIQDATSKGATLLCGGARHRRGGRFFEPTVLTGMTPSMVIAREETFGPVAALFKFETENEAVSLANDTEYGLAAYFYGRDVQRVWRVAEALEHGIIGINTGLISTEVAPFGGYKQSGIGREGSKYGLDEFLEIKYMCFGGIGA
jgi:succinate-semialdehyde dehydrogenase/glutarate-semialdehyde dehydrogenase